MEENQNLNPNENENVNPQKKKMGKAKKIIIAIIALLVIAIATVAVLGFTGVLEFNFTKKSKADAGLGKVGDVFSQTVTDFEKEYNEAGLKPKVLENENIDSFDASLKLSASINELEMEDLTSSDEEILDFITDVLNNVEFELSTKVTKDQGSMKFGATINEKPISVEVAYDDGKVGVRSEELNEKWLAMELQEVLDAMSEEIEIDEEALAELEAMTELYQNLIQDLMLTDEEVEHFKSTYSNIVKEYVLTLDIESEKDKIDVGDKEKNCTKTTITLDEDDIKDLLITFIEKVEDDEEGQEIIIEKMRALFDFVIENEELFESTEVASLYDDYYYDYDYYYDDYSEIDEIKEISEELDEIFSSDTFNEMKDMIEEIDLEGLEVTIESYSTLTKVYATDITFDIDGNGVVVSMVFDDNTTNATVGMKSSGMSMDIADVVLVNDKNHKSFEVKMAKDVAKYAGIEMSMKGDVEISDNQITTTVAFDLGDEGSVVVTSERIVKTNTDTQYDATEKLNLKIDVPDVMACDFTIKFDISLKTDNVKGVSIDEYVDITDVVVSDNPDDSLRVEVQQYVLDAVPGVVNVLESLKGFDMVEQELSTEIDELIDVLEDLSMDDFNTSETEPVIPEDGELVLTPSTELQ